MVLALDAVRRGRVVYFGAVAGLALVLYARMADGFFVGGLTIGPISVAVATILTVTGLLIAALTVLSDLLFEVVDDPREEAGSSV